VICPTFRTVWVLSYLEGSRTSGMLKVLGERALWGSVRVWSFVKVLAIVPDVSGHFVS
jgi:hypothetical protein